MNTSKKIIFLIIFLSLFFLQGCILFSQFENNLGDNLVNNNIKDDSRENIDNSESVYNNLSDFRRVKSGDLISVNYSGRLTTGELFDTSIGRQPLEFTAGSGQMIKGFDEAVIGMKIGEKKTITIKPEEAYGLVDEQKIVSFGKDSFHDFEKLEVGMMVSLENNLTGVIIEKKEFEAVIDFNHRLAGKTLVFDIEILSIK